MTRLTTTAATLLAASITVVSLIAANAGAQAGKRAKTSDEPAATVAKVAQSPDEGGIAGATIQPLSAVRVAVTTAQNPLVRPIFATSAPGDPTRLFILEKQGFIRVLKLDTTPPTLLVPKFLDIDALVTGGTTTGSEQGILGLAFHPDYQTNGYFYVFYTAVAGAGDITVARYQRATDDTANAGSASILLTIDDPQTNHNGGWMDFGPDGYLYISVGDGGNANDVGAGHTEPGGNGQDTTSMLLGKILRIDVDGLDNIPANDDDDGIEGNGSTNGYTSPPSNPFVGINGDDQIWAYGLRNPWRPSFDRETGDLYIADVGQDAWEEVDVQPANNPSAMPGQAGYMGGRNYGWRCREGNANFNFDSVCTAFQAGGGSFIAPVHTYAHGGSPFHCSITGGYCYRGTRLEALRGTYFFADYNCATTGESPIYTFNWNGAGGITNLTNRTNEIDPDVLGGGTYTIDSITSFGEDYYGEIYICDQDTAEIYKIVPACPSDIAYNNVVDVDDLVSVILGWGMCSPVPAACPADVVQNGVVDVDDLVSIILNWGNCPA